MHDIVIIDLGMGNIRSVMKAFQRINIAVVVTSDINIINKARKLILPGVGHFFNGMKMMQEHNLVELLTQKVTKEKTPILGICLGMQMFTRYSEEAECNGLGWVDAETRKVKVSDSYYKIPHMGWNTVEQVKRSPLLEGISESDRFYFVHSYAVICNNIENVLLKTNYSEPFISAFQHENIFGVQFHPEKSHKAGLRILENFTKI